MNSSPHLVCSSALEFLFGSSLGFQSFWQSIPSGSLILFLSLLNYLSEFSCNSLNFFMTTILNSPTVRSHSSVYLFIYLFLALLSLPCGARALCCGIWAFSSCSSQVLLLSWSMGSTTGKLSSCGTRAQLLPDVWDPSSLLSPGVAPGTPELEVRFLPTGLPVILNLASIKLSFSFCGVVLL